ncbi:putative integral membrane protein [Macrophomina phaseolina]|uniref:Integral membrane protein n=1 Tax=Macrophomina phaseolina TaxID=35725 RepID=A0ABQ8GBC6_9PEZI|nr:putative integral membrane protein [Macrophomina phaseolina]
MTAAYKPASAAGLAILCLAATARAHEHHMDNIEEGQYASSDPIDAVLWIHILLQSLAWGVLYPTGMVLGITRSRWHVPIQSIATVMAILGYILGHKHKGRQFAPGVHGSFAPWLMWLVFSQVIFGVYLKFHLEKGFHGRIRKYVVIAHGIVGKLIPIAAWTQMLFGGITALGFCREDHLGQCLAHFIMGSAFIAYGIIMTILLLVGQIWLKRTGRSQEFFDSVVIAAWGCVNTFTEHHWGGPWVHNDLQHTSMGIVWWCAGLVGIWLSRSRDGRPKRNLVPGIVILLTGFAMSAHPQSLPLSTMVHTVFGYTLMAAGITRIIEIAFVLKDKNAVSDDPTEISSWQHLPPFLLYASGFLFMGATEEQMALLSDAHVTHVSYVLILYSMSFLLYLFVNMLLHIYATWAWPESTKPDPETGRLNGHINGHARRPFSRSVEQRLRDAEEFELEGLISDDEEARLTADADAESDDGPRRKEARGTV